MANLKGESWPFIQWPSHGDGGLNRIGPTLAERMQHASSAANVIDEWAPMRLRGVEIREGGRPMFQDVWNEPPRQALGPGCDGGIVHRELEKLVREPDGAGDPVGQSVPVQASIPVEVCLAGFHGPGNHAEPQRP